MSLFSRAARLARSPKGKEAIDKAKDFANKPETKEKIEQVREKVAGKDKKATGAGTAGAEPDSPGTSGAQPGGSQPTTPPAGGTPPVNEPDDAAAGEQPAQGNPPQAP